MISRNNKYHGFTSTESINSDRFIEYMDEYTLTLKKLTVLVLDNASIHKSKKVKERVEDWKKRGLYIFYLPPYSPHLNLPKPFGVFSKGNGLSPNTISPKIHCLMPSKIFWEVLEVSTRLDILMRLELI